MGSLLEAGNRFSARTQIMEVLEFSKVKVIHTPMHVLSEIILDPESISEFYNYNFFLT